MRKLVASSSTKTTTTTTTILLTATLLASSVTFLFFCFFLTSSVNGQQSSYIIRPRSVTNVPEALTLLRRFIKEQPDGSIAYKCEKYAILLNRLRGQDVSQFSIAELGLELRDQTRKEFAKIDVETLRQLYIEAISEFNGEVDLDQSWLDLIDCLTKQFFATDAKARSFLNDKLLQVSVEQYKSIMSQPFEFFVEPELKHPTLSFDELVPSVRHTLLGLFNGDIPLVEYKFPSRRLQAQAATSAGVASAAGAAYVNPVPSSAVINAPVQTPQVASYNVQTPQVGSYSVQTPQVASYNVQTPQVVDSYKVQAPQVAANTASQSSYGVQSSPQVASYNVQASPAAAVASNAQARTTAQVSAPTSRGQPVPPKMASVSTQATEQTQIPSSEAPKPNKQSGGRVKQAVAEIEAANIVSNNYPVPAPKSSRSGEQLAQVQSSASAGGNAKVSSPSANEYAQSAQQQQQVGSDSAATASASSNIYSVSGQGSNSSPSEEQVVETDITASNPYVNDSATTIAQQQQQTQAGAGAEVELTSEEREYLENLLVSIRQLYESISNKTNPNDRCRAYGEIIGSNEDILDQKLVERIVDNYTTTTTTTAANGAEVQETTSEVFIPEKRVRENFLFTVTTFTPQELGEDAWLDLVHCVSQWDQVDEEVREFMGSSELNTYVDQLIGSTSTDQA